MNKPRICIIVAASKNGSVIGRDSDIPWPRLRQDMRNFRNLTIPHPYISGRKTFETIRDKDGNPCLLPDRLNIVVTRDPQYVGLRGAIVANSLQAAIAIATHAKADKIFIGGGGEIYRLALGYRETGEFEEGLCCVDEIYLTQVDLDVAGDIFFPEIPQCFRLVSQKEHTEEAEINGASVTIAFRFMHYVKEAA